MNKSVTINDTTIVSPVIAKETAYSDTIKSTLSSSNVVNASIIDGLKLPGTASPQESNQIFIVKHKEIYNVVNNANRADEDVKIYVNGKHTNTLESGKFTVIEFT